MTLTKRMEKKLDGNCTCMLRAILNKSWSQHPIKCSRTATYHPSLKSSRLDYAGHYWRGSKDELELMYSCGPLHMDEQGLGDQLKPINNSSILLQGVAGKTCRERWTIGTSGKRGSGKSMQAAQRDDDDDDDDDDNI